MKKIISLLLVILPNAATVYAGSISFSLGAESGYSKLIAAGCEMKFAQIGAIGNERNTDLYETRQWGAVNYTYAMGVTEVTVKQYATFLNDTGLSSAMFGTTQAPYLGLYQSDGIVGIRSGCENKAVSVISYNEAILFSNWLSTGDINIAGMFSLPTADEWHKAAYYDPNKNGTDQGGYWHYGTSNDSISIGDRVVNPDADVFSLGTGGSVSPNDNAWADADFGKENVWGLYGMTGGVEEWTSTPQNAAETRHWALGGSYNQGINQLDYTRVNNLLNTSLSDKTGFRIAADLGLIPEPSTYGIFLGIAVFGFAINRRKRQR